jgi:hypothetical protein
MVFAACSALASSARTAAFRPRHPDQSSIPRELLGAALNGFGVRREGNALLVKATTQDFSLRKHNLVQAILGSQ